MHQTCIANVIHHCISCIIIKVISKIAIIGMIITCTSCYDEIVDSIEILFEVFVSH